MTAFMLERFDPPPAYRRVLDYALTGASDRYRRDTGRGLLTAAREIRGEPAKRYRYALDAIHVLDKSSARVSPPSDPRNLTALHQAAEHLLADTTESELVREVQATIESIEQTTWPNFASLVQSPYFAKDFDLSHAQGLDAFEEWFKTVRPYFLTDVSRDTEQAFLTEFQPRLDMLRFKFSSDVSRDPYGLLDRYIEELWLDANAYFENPQSP